MKKLLKFLPCASLAFVLAFTPLVAAKKTRYDEEFPIKTQEYKRILTVWNIDTFEGGVGSRTDFLSRRAAEYCEDGLLMLVRSHTLESAKTAIANGENPTLVSFGTGVEFMSEIIKKLKLAGMSLADEYFVPWCSGGYFLLRKRGDDGAVEKLCVSDGENNIALGALYFSDLTPKEIIIEKSENAFWKLINGEVDALLGTQRDVRRLEVRNVEFSAMPLEYYSDLYQYIAVTANDGEDYAAATGFISYLLEGKTQSKVESLRMLPVTAVSGGDGAIYAYDRGKTTVAISPFLPKEVIVGLKNELLECVKVRKKCQSFENALKSPPNACN